MRGNIRGFTLVEILVVLSIISLLFSVVMISLEQARVRARDALRAQQAGQFVRALQLYFSEFGHYPCAYDDCTLTGVTTFGPTDAAPLALVNAGFMTSVPADPMFTADTCNSKVGATGYCYCSIGGDSYVLTVNTENDQGGSDRCYYREGPNPAGTLCTAHQSTNKSSATQSCNDRF